MHYKYSFMVKYSIVNMFEILFIVQITNTLQCNVQILRCASSALVKFCNAWSVRMQFWFSFILILIQFVFNFFLILVQFVSNLNVEKNLGGAFVSKQVGIVRCIQPRPRIDLVPNICHHCVQIVIASSLLLSLPHSGVLLKL